MYKAFETCALRLLSDDIRASRLLVNVSSALGQVYTTTMSSFLPGVFEKFHVHDSVNKKRFTQIWENE